ncbi:pyridoxamine 5'-phosphate oxidase family protein [Microbacterium sp. JZ31]|uniref:pyridoxamine 5'-phosphate oxidase family protein n=1 Tax=Microbacterium sp. JZ31 TaxID=1906274 RepID=UPI00300D2234
MTDTPPLGDVAAWLRALLALSGVPSPIDAGALPADPVEMFLAWIGEAVDAGVPEPHAATLATVDPDGIPDARTLILKDVGSRGWAFAGTRSSGKGRQLAHRPAAALDFWWQPLMRAVRARGPVVEATRAESEADLAARSPAAREGIPTEDWVLWRLVPAARRVLAGRARSAP